MKGARSYVRERVLPRPVTIAMSDFGQTALYPAFELPSAAFAGVRTRRLAAFTLDFTLVSVMALLLSTVLFVLTLGWSLVLLPSLWPFVAFFYNGQSVSGRHMATPGMRLFDLQLRTAFGDRPSFVAAALHGVLLYCSWLFPPVFLVSLLGREKRCLHDMVAGLVAVRRPD
jgi:uncharacterized RDD family membrane protein YckC